MKVKIVENKQVGQDYYKMKLACPEIALTAVPGQFVMVKVTDGPEPLLRRPLGIHRIYQKTDDRRQKTEEAGTFEILFEVVGKATRILPSKKSGDYLDIIGPLGNGFDYNSSIVHRPSSILVAGGMGVAPLLFLAENLVHSPQCPAVHRKPIVLLGAKNKKTVLCEEEFKKLGCLVKISTDDGSRGFEGKVTQLLRSLLWTMDYRLWTIYACGPRPMLKEISRISIDHALPAQVSLEEHMACGFGACLGCAVRVRRVAQTTDHRPQTDYEFKRVCNDGPVFDAEAVIWD